MVVEDELHGGQPVLSRARQAQLDEMGVDGFLAQTPETMWYSGPYRITEYIMNNTKTLTKNESYWDKDCTLFDTVTIRMLEDGNQDESVPSEKYNSPLTV